MGNKTCLDELEERLKKENISYLRRDIKGFLMVIHQIEANGISCTCQPFGHGYPDKLEIWDKVKGHNTFDCATVDEALEFIKGTRKFDGKDNGRNNPDREYTKEEKELLETADNFHRELAAKRRKPTVEEVMRDETGLLELFRKKPAETILLDREDFFKLLRGLAQPQEPNIKLRNLMAKEPRYVLSKDGYIYDREKDKLEMRNGQLYLAVVRPGWGSGTVSNGYCKVEPWYHYTKIEVEEEDNNLVHLIKSGNLVKGEYGYRNTPLDELKIAREKARYPEKVFEVHEDRLVSLSNVTAIYSLIGGDYVKVWSCEGGVRHPNPTFSGLTY